MRHPNEIEISEVIEEIHSGMIYNDTPEDVALLSGLGKNSYCIKQDRSFWSRPGVTSTSCVRSMNHYRNASFVGNVSFSFFKQGLFDDNVFKEIKVEAKYTQYPRLRDAWETLNGISHDNEKYVVNVDLLFPATRMPYNEAILDYRITNTSTSSVFVQIRFDVIYLREEIHRWIRYNTRYEFIFNGYRTNDNGSIVLDERRGNPFFGPLEWVEREQE